METCRLLLLYNNSEDARFFHGFTGTINHSWLTNQNACIDFVIVKMFILCKRTLSYRTERKYISKANFRYSDTDRKYTILSKYLDFFRLKPPRKTSNSSFHLLLEHFRPRFILYTGNTKFLHVNSRHWTPDLQAINRGKPKFTSQVFTLLYSRLNSVHPGKWTILRQVLKEKCLNIWVELR